MAFAAAHVVMRPGYAHVGHSLQRPGREDEIREWLDFEATGRVRAWLAGQGFGIAEAMDTAQRFRIGWDTAAELIRRLSRQPPATGWIAGAGMDGLVNPSRSLVIDRVVEQGRFIQEHGGMVMLLPLPWLTERACGPDEVVALYRDVVAELDGPLFVHWLGEQFLPALKGYFPGNSFLDVMRLDPARVRGAKLSLLDARREVVLRRELLSRDQILLTGDDFHFADLIRGGDPGVPLAALPAIERWTDVGGHAVALGDFSHALLGVLDGVATPAARALECLARQDLPGYLQWMQPLEALGQWIFSPPTQHYKAGLAFLSWLRGQQSNFFLVDHEERARSREHYARLAVLARAAGAIDLDDEALRLRLATLGDHVDPSPPRS